VVPAKVSGFRCGRAVPEVPVWVLASVVVAPVT